MTEVRLRALGPEDAEECDAIIAGLRYHFAHEQGRLDCAAAVRRDAGLVATEGAQVVGFLTYVHRFDEAAEITWMAVRADRRRRGIGHELIERLAELLAAEGRRILLVLTVSPSDPAANPTMDTSRPVRSIARRGSCWAETCVGNGMGIRPS